MIIGENQLSSAHNILSMTKLKMKTTKTTPPQQQTKTAIVDKLAPISAQGNRLSADRDFALFLTEKKTNVI